MMELIFGYILCGILSLVWVLTILNVVMIIKEWRKEFGPDWTMRDM